MTWLDGLEHRDYVSRALIGRMAECCLFTLDRDSRCMLLAKGHWLPHRGVL
jgi:hypothetical protein